MRCFSRLLRVIVVGMSQSFGEISVLDGDIQHLTLLGFGLKPKFAA